MSDQQVSVGAVKSMTIPVSVLILSLNEECNIARCIKSISWCDDIVVLDSGSQDATREITEAHGARLFERAFDDFASQRNFALENFVFKYEWVLHLDADEVVTSALRDEIVAAIAHSKYRAYRVPSKLMFLGKWLRFSGMYPTYQVRLGHVEHLRFKQVGHGQRELLDRGLIGTLQQPYLHFCFSKGLSEWIEKHNRYSTDEAFQGLETGRIQEAGWKRLLSSADKTERRRALKKLAARLPFRPTLRFVYMYLFRLGFLDGRAGFIYCRLMASYEYWIVLKTREIRKG